MEACPHCRGVRLRPHVMMMGEEEENLKTLYLSLCWMLF